MAYLAQKFGKPLNVNLIELFEKTTDFLSWKFDVSMETEMM